MPWMSILVEDSRTNGENGNEQVEVPVDGVNGTIKKTKKKKKKATTTKGISQLVLSD